MGVLRKLSERCKACPHVDTKKKKKMESCGYIEPKISADLASPVLAEMVQPMAIRHDYRNIKVAENTTITIDVEDLNRQMKKDFYRQMGIGFYPGA